MAEAPGKPGPNEEGLGKKIRDVLKLLRDAVLQATEPEALQKTIADIARLLRAATAEHGDVELAISTNRITVGDDVAYKSDAREGNIAFDLFRQGLRRLSFKPGVTDEEADVFVRRFLDCRAAEAQDEDFVATLWREELPSVKYVAIDGFTEKIFMSDERFVRSFRAVIDDVMPGLVEMSEEDVGDREPRKGAIRDDASVLARVDDAMRDFAGTLEVAAVEVQGRFHVFGSVAASGEHLLQLLGRIAVKHPSPLPGEELVEAIVAVLALMLRDKAWSAFADASRTLLTLADAADDFPEAVRPALKAVRRAAVGREVVQALASHLDPEKTDFTAWARWHLVKAGEITAPDLLKLINVVEWPPGVDFLKDLLRRQGTSSLDPWAERLKDDDPQVVLEVLDVILSSELGAQARPLLIETLRNPAPEVRARAVDGLSGAYDLQLREALLPLLRDPAATVRRSVLERFAGANDRSVAPYVANTVKSPDFELFDEDEQRAYFEALARLGGERFLDVFRARLRLEGGANKLAKLLKRATDAVHDDPVRRAAISGLATMNVPAALALVREVRDRADHDLAAHCEVALRLAQRGGSEPRQAGAATAGDKPKGATKPAAIDDIEAGRERMGDRRLFEPAMLKVTPPPRPKPRPVDVAVAVAAPAAAPVAAPVESVPLSELPLLGEGEVFLPTDERRLKAEPSISTGPKFRLTSPRATLVGVPQADAPQVELVAAPTPLPSRPARIVERAAIPTAGADYTHNPEASLEDLLSSYLTDVDELVTETPPRGDDEEDDDPRVDASALGRGRSRIEAFALGDEPPIVDVSAEELLLEELPPLEPPPLEPPPLPRAATPPPAPRPQTGALPPLSTPPPRPPAAPPAPPAAAPPPAAPPAPAAAAPANTEDVDDLLKAFLDLDLGE